MKSKQETFLILQPHPLRSGVITVPMAGEQGLALSEQITSWGKERRWETEELKGHQQQELEGELQFPSHLPPIGCTGASLQV